jgi:hypothetical protein
VVLFPRINGTEGRGVLKGSRWLLLKNPGNLRDDHNERTRLEEALSLNKPLASAYYMLRIYALHTTR